MLGRGSQVFAKLTDDVGQSGSVFVAVIMDSGTGCIGAYLVRPSCSSYGIAHGSPATDACAAAGSATAAARFVLSVEGPAVPETPAKAVLTASEKVPVMPLTVKRSE
jgi:hypothetical protein